ncbi:DUF5753 domain-containing protein [Streptomyces cavernae]|uniref:DUF5753 domain-containing protein n=1 Tax=Streptomyces cavernae TaxID=2259034 RepID=UPI000FEBF933|nr:DUF5753 domain-containing protein [Streptomyces cavernae]
MTTVWESPAETLGDHIHRLAAIEADADSVEVWQPLFIPGLLQAFGYAAAAIHATTPALPLEAVAARAEKRSRRIDELGQAGGRRIGVVVDESALYRPVGGLGALVDQLEHLLALAALQPSLSVQVLPQGGDAHPGLAGPFTLYRAGGRRAVFTESLTNSVISTRPDDVAAHVTAWERLCGLALPPDKSLDLIDNVREVLCRRLKTGR